MLSDLHAMLGRRHITQPVPVHTLLSRLNHIKEENWCENEVSAVQGVQKEVGIKLVPFVPLIWRQFLFLP